MPSSPGCSVPRGHFHARRRGHLALLEKPNVVVDNDLLKIHTLSALRHRHLSGALLLRRMASSLSRHPNDDGEHPGHEVTKAQVSLLRTVVSREACPFLSQRGDIEVRQRDKVVGRP